MNENFHFGDSLMLCHATQSCLGISLSGMGYQIQGGVSDGDGVPDRDGVLDRGWDGYQTGAYIPVWHHLAPHLAPGPYLAPPVPYLVPGPIWSYPSGLQSYPSHRSPYRTKPLKSGSIAKCKS